MSKRKSKKIQNAIISLIVLLIIFLVAYFTKNEELLSKIKSNVSNTVQSVYSNVIGNETKESNENDSTIFTSSEATDTIDLNNDKLNVVFFYVGQADCTLIKMNDSVMLIDAGNNEDGKNIVNYLKTIGINKIDYLIGTHADEDHIGGLDDIVSDLEISKIYMPQVGSEVANYKNVVKAAEKKNLKVETPKVGDTFKIGNANCEVMSVLNDGDTSDNNSSIVIEMKYNNNSFLFMGDAEKEAENSRSWNKVDVLKVGHHGSNTSSSDKFLSQVSAHYAVIEVGKNNSYKLPNIKAIERIEKSGATILRTDTNCSTFWMTSDGNAIDEKEVNVNLDGNS